MGNNPIPQNGDGPTLSLGFIEPDDPIWPDLKNPAISLMVGFDENAENHEFDYLLEPMDVPLYYLVSLEACDTSYRVVLWFIAKPAALDGEDKPTFFCRFDLNITAPDFVQKMREFCRRRANIMIGAGFWCSDHEMVTKWFIEADYVYNSEDEMKLYLERELGVELGGLVSTDAWVLEEA